MLAEKKIRIGVLVSGGGTNLQALINSENKGELCSGKLSLVISSSKDAYALTRAEKAGIKTAVVARGDFNNALDFDLAIERVLSENNIDMVVLAGFLCILGEGIIKKYPKRIINVHPSLIPSFCGKGYYGLRVHEEALKKGVKVTGATVHFVNEIPDGGEIILQKAVNILPNDTAKTLQKRVMRLAEWKILPKAVEIEAKKLLEQGGSV